MLISSFLFLLVFFYQIISKIQPTREVRIPENFTGPVYLFSSDIPSGSIEVNEFGIGYNSTKLGYLLKVTRNETEISNVLYESSSISLEICEWCRPCTYVQVLCFEVNESGSYPKKDNGRMYYFPCMDTCTLKDWTNFGMIDTSIIDMRKASN